MTESADIIDLITTGQVMAIAHAVGDPDELATRLSEQLQRLKPHSAVVLVTAPEGSVRQLSTGSEHRTNLFFSTLDDPSVELAQQYIERLMPEHVDLPDPVVLTQMYRNVRLRVAFLREHETWTTAEVAGFAGSRARNVSATAARWRAEGLVFAIEHEGQMRFPAFQFDVDRRRPREALAPVLEVLRTHDASDWEIALWFAARHPRLSAAPLTALDSAPEAVLDAARATYSTPT